MAKWEYKFLYGKHRQIVREVSRLEADGWKHHLLHFGIFFGFVLVRRQVAAK